MGFYGNVTYYLSNAFQSLVYQNSNMTSTISPPASPAAEYTTTPRSRNDRSILAQGNKWLVFAADSNSANNNTINIYHATYSGNSEPSELEVGITASETNLVSPDFGSIITIPTITFDNAGHIINGSVANVKLPVPAGAEDLNNIKNRIATLEEYLTGSHGEDGSGSGSSETPVPDVSNDNTYSARIGTLEKITEEWERKKGAGYESDPMERYREEKGIGSTLHEIMEMIGTRSSTTITDNNQQKTVYVPVSSNFSNDSLLGKTDTAIALARAQSGNISSNRGYLIDIYNYLNSIGAGLSVPPPISN